MEWRNQVAVVTGGSRGIGRATARLLAQRGAAVCVNYAVNADAAEALVAEITTARGRAIAVVADVADSAGYFPYFLRRVANFRPWRNFVAGHLAFPERNVMERGGGTTRVNPL